MNTFDIIVIFITIIIIVVIIGINVSSVIDNKLSNVAVNIPPIKIPSPQVIVKVQKTCGSSEYDVFIEKSTGQQDEQTVSLSPLDSSKSQNEHFTENDDKKLVLVEGKMQKISVPESPNPIHIVPKYENVIQTNLKNIQFPNEDSDVDYSIKSTINDAPITIPEIKNKAVCQNASLDNARTDSYHYMSENSRGLNEYVFPLCNDDKLVNNINDEEMEILENYRRKQVYIRGNLEDPVVRGYNINSYDNNTALEGIGKIPLTNNFKQPKPSGYIFDTSPAYIR